MSMSMITPALFLSNIMPNPMAGLGIPTRSIDFESGSTQYLSMSDASFGAFNYAKFAASFWYKKESTGALSCPELSWESLLLRLDYSGIPPIICNSLLP